jgi:hypothetical protein
MNTLRQALALPHLFTTSSSNAAISWSKSAFQLEDAQLLWSSGDADGAVRSARQVLRSVPILVDTKTASTSSSTAAEDELNVLRVDALCLLGEWLSSSYLEASSGIKSYLEQAGQ